MLERTTITLLLAILHVAPVHADDIDVYRPESAGEAHFLLAFDLDESGQQNACDSLGSCQPPYLSPATFRRLQNQRSLSPDKPVSRLEVLLSVLSETLSRPRFDAVHFALMLRLGDRVELVQPYRRLADSRTELEAALWSLPEREPAEIPATGSPLLIYPEWLRLLQGGGLALASEQCPRFYSMLFSSATSERWADLASTDSEWANPALPAHSITSASALMTWLHGDRVDFLDGQEQRQHLSTSWLVGGDPEDPLLGELAVAAGAPRPFTLTAPRILEQQLSTLLRPLAPQAQTLGQPGVLPPGPLHNGQVFLPLFAGQTGGDWPGNLKKLRLAIPLASELERGIAGYRDVDNQPAIEPNHPHRGQIASDALTFWTDPDALPLVAAGADGRQLLLGGAGQQLTRQAGIPEYPDLARRLYLEPARVTNGAANTLVPLLAEQATLAAAPYLMELPAAVDDDSALDWLAWLGGQDIDDEDGDGNTVEARSWLLGGLIHSRPAVINYGVQQGHSPANPLVRIYTGSNSGWLHAFDNTTPAGEESGREYFAFLPREMLANQHAQRSRTTPRVGPGFYGIDGSPVSWLDDRNGDGEIMASEGERAWLFFGLRRGGTAYYALDVSDPAEPPVLRWKLTPEPGGDFEELALGFAEPVVGRVQFEDEPRDVVILTGGYHGGVGEAGEPLGKDAGRGPDSRGNAIFVVDAESGELLWKAAQGNAQRAGNRRFEHPQLSDSFPSTPAVLRDSASRIYRVYVGDSGGAVWRLDLPPGVEPDHRAQHWFVSKFAELAGEGAAEDRRFFHPPDLVRSHDAEGTAFDGILIASGNRAAAGLSGVSDGLFYLKDYATAPYAPDVREREPGSFVDLPDRTDCLSGQDAEGSAASEGNTCDTNLQHGWRLMFTGDGEKGLSTPLTEAGQVFFTSYVPPTAAERCAGEVGRSVLYRVELEDGAALDEAGRGVVVGEGLPQSLVTLGDSLLLPGAGVSPRDGGTADRPAKLIPQQGATLIQLYWREPGRDDL